MTQGIHLEIIFNVFLGGRQLEIIIFDSKKRRGGHDIPPKQKSWPEIPKISMFQGFQGRIFQTIQQVIGCDFPFLRSVSNLEIGCILQGWS